eukprot:gene17318-biopygen381
MCPGPSLGDVPGTIPGRCARDHPWEMCPGQRRIDPIIPIIRPLEYPKLGVPTRRLEYPWLGYSQAASTPTDPNLGYSGLRLPQPGILQWEIGKIGESEKSNQSNRSDQYDAYDRSGESGNQGKREIGISNQESGNRKSERSGNRGNRETRTIELIGWVGWVGLFGSVGTVGWFRVHLPVRSAPTNVYIPQFEAANLVAGNTAASSNSQCCMAPSAISLGQCGLPLAARPSRGNGVGGCLPPVFAPDRAPASVASPCSRAAGVVDSHGGYNVSGYGGPNKNMQSGKRSPARAQVLMDPASGGPQAGVWARFLEEILHDQGIRPR